MTTNLTTRSAQADPITAVPPRSVPQGTQTAWFTRLLLLALLASFTIPLAHAQVTYTYTGKTFNVSSGLWTSGDRITATLTTPGLLPANISNFTTCPAGTTFSLTAGSVTLDTKDNNVILDSCLITTDVNGNMQYWWVESEDPTYDIYTLNRPIGATDKVSTLQPPFYEGVQTITPGTWASPTAQNITTALLGHLTGDLNIPGLGTSLVDQVTLVLTDLNNNYAGQACTDLQIFASHVKAQTGKKIPSAQAPTIMQWVGWIAAAIPGCQVH